MALGQGVDGRRLRRSAPEAKVFDHLAGSKQWGRYFERMTRHQTLKNESYNPLKELIDKLKGQADTGHCFKATHELAVYDPLLDRRYRRGGPCLSFLSFKLHPDMGLLLTAMYRNHHYIGRCLGNLWPGPLASLRRQGSRGNPGFTDLRLDARRTRHWRWIGNQGSEGVDRAGFRHHERTSARPQGERGRDVRELRDGQAKGARA